MKAKELKQMLENIPDDVDINFIYNFTNYFALLDKINLSIGGDEKIYDSDNKIVKYTIHFTQDCIKNTKGN